MNNQENVVCFSPFKFVCKIAQPLLLTITNLTNSYHIPTKIEYAFKPTYLMHLNLSLSVKTVSTEKRPSVRCAKIQFNSLAVCQPEKSTPPAVGHSISKSRWSFLFALRDEFLWTFCVFDGRWLVLGLLKGLYLASVFYHV